MLPFSRLLRRTAAVRSRTAAPRLNAESLEVRTLLSSVSVVGAEARVMGTNAENNNFTIDYNDTADEYTITDTNAITAVGANVTQVNANTVTVDGGALSNRILVRTFAGTNSVAVNANGGADFGNEGLRINDDAGTESILIGDGGVAVAGPTTIANRGQIVLLGDTIELDGDLTTFDQAIRVGNTATGSTVTITGDVDVMGNGVLGQVAFDSEIVDNGGQLRAEGENVFFNESITIERVDAIASNLVTLDGDLTLVGGGVRTAVFVGDTQVDVSGAITGGDFVSLESADIRVDDVETERILFRGGTIDFGGTVAPVTAGTGLATFQSRVPGETVSVFNLATAPNDLDAMNVDLTDLAEVASFGLIQFGGMQSDGSQTTEVEFVGDLDNGTRLLLPGDVQVVAETITLGEGIDTGVAGTSDYTIDLIAMTIDTANNRPFSGDGEVGVLALSMGIGGDGTVTVNGRFVGRGGTTVPDLVLAGGEVTFAGEVGSFASVTSTAGTLNLDHFTALTSEGDITLNSVVNSDGGLFADGNILVDGDLNLTGDQLLMGRTAGVDITVTGDVIGNGFDFQARGRSADVGTISLGDVTNVGRFSILRATDANLGTVQSNGAASGSDVQVRVANNLSIGGDITAPDTIDLRFATADLDGGNRTIAVSGDQTDRIQLIGDLVGTETLTVDIDAGSFVRVGADGGVTVNQV